MRPALALPLMLAACAPLTVQQAEEICAERARQAQAPGGTLGLGAGSGGVYGELELNVTSDYLMGRDPLVVYDDCVRKKTGQPPTRPLYFRQDRKG